MLHPTLVRYHKSISTTYLNSFRRDVQLDLSRTSSYHVVDATQANNYNLFILQAIRQGPIGGEISDDRFMQMAMAYLSSMAENKFWNCEVEIGCLS